MTLTPLMIRSVVRLVNSLTGEPASSISTILYYSDLLPQSIILQRLVRHELLDRENYLFLFLISFLRELMLGGLLRRRRGFSFKCKSLIKATRTRINWSWKRTEATQRFLKGNLAKLLATGHEVTAYARSNEFIGGENMLWCYEYLQGCLEFIWKQLPVLQENKGGCPEECIETIGSVMFAAEWFGNMPELRKLRDVFKERYSGTSLEPFVSSDLAEKITSQSFTTEDRLQLLQTIALENSINWDSNDFQWKLQTSSISDDDAAGTIQDQEQPKTLELEQPAAIISSEEIQKLDMSFSNSDQKPIYLNTRTVLGEINTNVVPIKSQLLDISKEEDQEEEEEADKQLKRVIRRININNNNNIRSETETETLYYYEDENEQDDEEELMLDKLVLHYCRRPSIFDPKTLIMMPSSSSSNNNNQESIQLPKHVHPNLPDYHDLETRLKALKASVNNNDI